MMTQMLIAALALAIAGWILVYISLRRMLRRTCAGLRREFQEQVDSLSASVGARERTAGGAPAATPARVSPGNAEPLAANAVATIAAQAPATAIQAAEEVTPEALVAIARTVTALLGSKVRIRSVKILRTPNAIANPWAEHGRVVVQASHNLAQQR